MCDKEVVTKVRKASEDLVITCAAFTLSACLRFCLCVRERAGRFLGLPPCGGSPKTSKTSKGLQLRWAERLWEMAAGCGGLVGGRGGWGLCEMDARLASPCETALWPVMSNLDCEGTCRC